MMHRAQLVQRHLLQSTSTLEPVKQRQHLSHCLRLEFSLELLVSLTVLREDSKLLGGLEQVILVVEKSCKGRQHLTIPELKDVEGWYRHTSHHLAHLECIHDGTGGQLKQ